MTEAKKKEERFVTPPPLGFNLTVEDVHEVNSRLNQKIIFVNSNLMVYNLNSQSQLTWRN